MPAIEQTVRGEMNDPILIQPALLDSRAAGVKIERFEAPPGARNFDDCLSLLAREA
jgi:hypothetical protein